MVQAGFNPGPRRVTHHCRTSAPALGFATHLTHFRTLPTNMTELIIKSGISPARTYNRFLPDAMLARSLRQQRVCLSVRLTHAGIVPRAKAGS